MYEDLKKVNFPILDDRFIKGRTRTKEVEVKNPEEFQLPVQASSRPRRSKYSSPPVGRISISTTCNSLLLHGIAIPLSVSIQTPVQNLAITNMAVPWGNAIGPLNLADNHDLPRASRKNFPKFNGDGTVSAEQYLSSFHKACSVVNPQKTLQ